MVTLETRVYRNPQVVCEVLDGEGVLYHERTHEIHLLNPTATLIWDAFDGRDDVGSVIATFVELTGGPFDAIQRDVLETLDGFARLDLIVTDPEAPARSAEGGSDG
jgi:hypothetical protein